MKRLLPFIVLFIPLLGFAQFSLTSDKTEVQPLFDYAYRDTMILGGDGYRLATQLWLPEGDGPWPVVVLRTPYFNFPMGDFLPGPREYARRGIGFIIQRCRGTGGSEGSYEPNIYEREDGLALLSWLQDAPWCESIGLTGASYMGLTCWIVADALPPKVKGIYLEHYGVDRHLSAYNSGLFRQDILTGWAIDNAKEPIAKPEVPDRDRKYFTEMAFRPQVRMDETLLGAALPWYRDWITHTDYTDPYWHEGVWGMLRDIPSKIKVPMTIVAGHFDHHMEGTLLGYELLSPDTKSRSRLIVGGWNHSYVTTPTFMNPVHDHDLDIEKDTFEWMYRLLVEKKEPIHEVKVYAIGEDRWLDLGQWPTRVKDEKKYYLSSESEGASNLLKERKPRGKGFLSFIYDPTNPVESIGGETLFTSETRRGSRLQKEVGYRDDILFFRTGPLDKDMMISGKILARLQVSSDAEDTSFSFKISEELPDGSTYNIRTGIATLAFRKDRLGPRRKYRPGRKAILEIECLPIVWKVSEGSRIRVDISSSDFPQYSVHPNKAGVWSEIGETAVARQKVFVSGRRTSRIMIPLLDGAN